MELPPFAVNWDYRCPFARVVHDHLITGLADGAPWQVTFLPFSLDQTYVAEGRPAVWDDPASLPKLYALASGVVVRDRYPEKFLDVHRALFAARHEQGRDLRDPAVVSEVLEGTGVPGRRVLAEVEDGWPLLAIRDAHEDAVKRLDVFGVPTFFHGDDAVFVRLMKGPEGDATVARSTIERIVDLVVHHPEMNEFKHTQLPR